VIIGFCVSGRSNDYIIDECPQAVLLKPTLDLYIPYPRVTTIIVRNRPSLLIVICIDAALVVTTAMVLYIIIVKDNFEIYIARHYYALRLGSWYSVFGVFEVEARHFIYVGTNYYYSRAKKNKKKYAINLKHRAVTHLRPVSNLNLPDDIHRLVLTRLRLFSTTYFHGRTTARRKRPR